MFLIYLAVRYWYVLLLVLVVGTIWNGAKNLAYYDRPEGVSLDTLIYRSNGETKFQVNHTYLRPTVVTAALCVMRTSIYAHDYSGELRFVPQADEHDVFVGDRLLLEISTGTNVLTPRTHGDEGPQNDVPKMERLVMQATNGDDHFIRSAFDCTFFPDMNHLVTFLHTIYPDAIVSPDGVIDDAHRVQWSNVSNKYDIDRVNAEMTDRNFWQYPEEKPVWDASTLGAAKIAQTIKEQRYR
jgi:hypothetical protein